MKEQKKKKFIAILLFISCFVSGYMLFASPEGASKHLRSLAQADTLIQQELESFNIQNRQLHTSTINVDSNFNRKIYRVGVPFKLSKTQLHAELNRVFYDYGVKTPARVSFPQKDVRIDLVYQGTVIRSIILQTDPDLVFTKNKVSILVAFNEMPDNELISKLASLGEPIPLVLKVTSPMEANEMAKKLKSRYQHILFWLQNDDGEDLIKTNPDKAVNKLKQLEDIMPDAEMLLLNTNSHNQSTEAEQKKLMAKTNLSFVNASDALMLHEGLGRASFRHELDKLVDNSENSMALITGNETTVMWLSEKLPELTKAGVDIIYPPKSHF